MDIKLIELSLNDGKDIFDMIKEIGPGENGFTNGGYNMDYNEFPSYLKRKIEISGGINLEPGHVPQTIYWLMIDDKPVGMGKLRCCLTENLKKSGGHTGYTIRPSERGKGYGNIILRGLLKKAKEKGILEVLLTCNEDNVLSRKVIEENHGLLENITDQGKCRYWIHNF